MECSFINGVRAVVADTYLAYTSDMDGAEAFIHFVNKENPLLDVRKDPKFSAFSDDELIDEMFLLEQDIIRLLNENF
ncbi:MAG: hypothetical protein CML07_06830 [Psychrobacter sp.]|nr:hypothetical protein [Psychrobacter sp.]